MFEFELEKVLIVKKSKAFSYEEEKRIVREEPII